MIPYWVSFAVSASLTAILLWQVRHHRKTAVVLAVALTGALYVSATEPLGHAKPARIELLYTLDGANIWWSSASKTDGIYIIVDGPKLYHFPYTEKLARELYEASEKAEEGGGKVKLHMRRDGTEGGLPSAGWEPPASNPPKN